MKKITIIASLLIVFTACQKADIRPRSECGTPTPEMKSISEDGSGATVGTPNALSGPETGTPTPTVDPNDPNNPNGGDITDPLRKKDQKDNK